MKKLLQFLICVMPLLLLGTLYICILGFHMSDGNIWGMLMIMISAVLSVLTPTIGLLTRLFRKPRFRNRSFIICSFLSGVVYWLACYFDFGHRLHQFIAS